MGFFDRIKDKIFGSAKAEERPAPTGAAPSAAPASPAAPAPTPATPAPAGTAGSGSAAATGGGAPAGTTQAPAAPAAPAPASTPAPTPAQNVDVAAILDAKQKSAGQTLDWRRSIVDLLKLLDIDSSLSARKELAQELNYTGDTDDSATMNVWLHKAVMKKLAENGGEVPADLRD